MSSNKAHEVFTEADGREYLREVFYHFYQRLRGFRALGMTGVVHKVASSSKLAITMLMIVAAHLLFECGLMLLQLVEPMREEAVLPVLTKSMLTKTAAQF